MAVTEASKNTRPTEEPRVAPVQRTCRRSKGVWQRSAPLDVRLAEDGGAPRENRHRGFGGERAVLWRDQLRGAGFSSDCRLEAGDGEPRGVYQSLEVLIGLALR